MDMAKRRQCDPSRATTWTDRWAQVKRRCLGTGVVRVDVHDAHHATNRSACHDPPTLSSLPPEMTAAIVSHCAIDTLVRLQRTSRSLSVAASRVLAQRRRRVVATASADLLLRVADAFLSDDDDAIGILLMTGHPLYSVCFPGRDNRALRSICFPGGDDCTLDFSALRAGHLPFDYKAHFGGAFVTMSPVALAVWAGAVRVLALLAGTTARCGHARHSLLTAAVCAADGALACGRVYPLGAMIDVIVGMTPPIGLLRRLLQPQADEPPLVSLLRAAQATASAIARVPMTARRGDHDARTDMRAMAAAVGGSLWQLERLVDRACGDATAYSAPERKEALYLALAAAHQVQLACGVAALVDAGLGTDARMCSGRHTVADAFFGLVSEEPPKDDAEGLHPTVAVAHATLALLTMILCNRRAHPTRH